MHRSQNVKLRNPHRIDCWNARKWRTYYWNTAVIQCLSVFIVFMMWCVVFISAMFLPKTSDKTAMLSSMCELLFRWRLMGGVYAITSSSSSPAPPPHSSSFWCAHSSVIKLIGDPRYIIQYRESEITLIGLTVSEWFSPPSDPAHTSHQPISTQAAVIYAIKPRPMIHCSSSSSSITPGLDLVNDYMTG